MARGKRRVKMSAQAVAVCSASVTRTQESVECVKLSIASLAGRADSLPRRFAASLVALSEGVSLAAGVTAIGREAAHHARQLSNQAGKAWEGAAEEARVRAAQLEAHALQLEREEEGEGEEGMRVEAAARALLCYDTESTSHAFVCIPLCAALLSREALTATRILRVIEPSLCITRGKGLTTFQGGNDNVVTVVAVDVKGGVVESIEAGDVHVKMKGAIVTSVAVAKAGCVEIGYSVPIGCYEPVSLEMSVCGAELPGSPWIVRYYMLADSAILASVAPERIAAFLDKLSGWLPGRAYTLLYRGSRDGMTAAAFHRSCDRKGPTLVLVRCDKGFVFGGHASASWESPPHGNDTNVVCDASRAFLFSATGPYTTAPVRFSASRTWSALYCTSHFGPCFTGGLYVRAGRREASACFDGEGSFCCIGIEFDDVIGRGKASLTGAESFTPVEVEVFGVTHI